MIDKKLIAVFRTFVDKIFLPNLKKTDPAIAEWNKLNQLLSNDSNNYEEAAQYVDSIGMVATQPTFTPLEKREMPLFKKRPEADSTANNNEGGGFNPSKTFGGERARMMFMKGEADDFGEQKQGVFGFNAGRNLDESKRNQAAINPQIIFPGLERLCKTFL
jgi:hypothetical protein